MSDKHISQKKMRKGIVMNRIEAYYNKFNEEKRLNSRHGRIEFILSMEYIHKYLKPGDKILDLGAGTGRYSIPLFEEGYDVTAVELVQNNLGRLKLKNPDIKAYKGNALHLRRFFDNMFDLTLVFGPLYHLTGFEQKKKALLEAKRVTKPGGIIMVAYVMNEYAVLTYGFKERHILENLKDERLSEDYHVQATEEDLYDFVRMEDIDRLNEETGLKRLKIFSPDGAANYIRPFLNQLTEEEFQKFIDYQRSVCERKDLIGAAAHTVDILLKEV